MSQENVEIVRSLYEALNRREVSRLLELWHTDGEWRPAIGPGGIERETYAGPAGVHRWLQDIDESWREFEAVELSFRRVDDHRVLVVGRLRGRGAASGVDIDAPFVALWKLRDAKILRGTGYLNLEDAHEAEGLPEEGWSAYQ